MLLLLPPVPCLLLRAVVPSLRLVVLPVVALLLPVVAVLPVAVLPAVALRLLAVRSRRPAVLPVAVLRRLVARSRRLVVLPVAVLLAVVLRLPAVRFLRLAVVAVVQRLVAVQCLRLLVHLLPLRSPRQLHFTRTLRQVLMNSPSTLAMSSPSSRRTTAAGGKVNSMVRRVGFLQIMFRNKSLFFTLFFLTHFHSLFFKHRINLSSTAVCE